MVPFPLGQIVATTGALKLLEEVGAVLYLLLARHSSGDWGEVDAHDWRENELYLKHGWRLKLLFRRGRSGMGYHRGRQVRHHHPPPGGVLNALCLLRGDRVVTARCNRCGVYSNPREMAKASPGGRCNTYSGTCGQCAKTSRRCPCGGS